MIFLCLEFWPKVIIFGSMKGAGIFLGREEKKRRDFFGYVKKSSDIFG